MERIKKIQMHTRYRELYDQLYEVEKERAFCRHTMEHFLDVARLMYIYNLEEQAGLAKELIYAAALLHDIGRLEQLTAGTPHDEASARLAAEIMGDCGFAAAEVAAVQRAVLGHRRKDSLASTDALTRYLYRADKKSRNCFCCPAEADCNWPPEKKNMWITD